ncbi:hypothetical protein H5410_022849 [Solanum commersonii]|uniref:Uncharacterized protein n=1 Tax=Solanum commersonii TaxID=4109 RepID=A0A9J5ZI95_SOLCO|nr:hypothetical protein H5410_022849 [Solanum commersonii]
MEIALGVLCDKNVSDLKMGSKSVHFGAGLTNYVVWVEHILVNLEDENSRNEDDEIDVWTY